MRQRPTLFDEFMAWLGFRKKPKAKKRGKKKKAKRSLAAAVPSGRGATTTSREVGFGDYTEPRRAARPNSLEAFCRSVASVKDEPWPARVRDLSAGSIGLLINRRFEPGTLLVIELEQKAQSLSHTLVGRVVHATQNSEGWMVGCTLANKIADDDLQALLV